MSDKCIFMAFSAAAVTFVIFVVALINVKSERCEAVGGHTLSVYKGSLCVRDGLIVEDY
jgi:hypothetical protein